MSRVLALLGLVAFVAGAVIAFEARPASSSGLPWPAASAPPNAATNAALRTLAPIPPGYRIQIPRLGIDLEILEGDVERDTVALRTPEDYAFHLPGTAIPGTGANSYLYAHARMGMFISLWDARVGDVVWISTPDGRALRYVVSEVHPSVPPDEISWAAAAGPERLTLQTSTGPAPNDPRFIVVALPG